MLYNLVVQLYLYERFRSPLFKKRAFSVVRKGSLGFLQTFLRIFFFGASFSQCSSMERKEIMRKKVLSKKFFTTFFAVTLAVSMTACTGGGQNNSGDAGRIDSQSVVKDNQAETSTEAAVDAEKQESEKKTEYPLTITSYGPDGEEYTSVYEKAPEKVAAVYQGCVETLLALGLEDRIVATAGLDNAVPENLKAAFSKTNYLDEFTPSKETMTMLEPDMIFSWGSLFGTDTLGSPQEWAEKGANVYINTNTAIKNDSLENEYNDILNMGKIFDVQDKAETIVNNMKETIQKVKEQATSQTESPSVMVVESANDSFTNYGASSIAGDMVTQLGGTLANPDASVVGKEDIVAADPDVIFVVYMPYTGDDPETVKQDNLNKILKDEAFASLSAIKNDRMVPIMLSEMYASATRTQDGIETIAKGLYPDMNLAE